MHRYAWRCGGLAACLALVACASPPPPPPPAEIWPTLGWQSSTPEAQGVDSVALADAIETLKAHNIPIHSLLVERNGHIVLDAHFFPFADNEPHDVASVTKSVTSTLVGIALNDTPSLDVNAPIGTLLPGTELADPRKSAITLGNLLSMTSGIDCSEDHGRSLLAQMESTPHWSDYVLTRPVNAAPGALFSYCAGNMQLVSAVLTRATGKSAFDLAREKLFAPLGIIDVAWPADPDGVSHGFADLRLEPRDLAKLGYLWLHGGRWENKQLIAPAYLKAALSAQANVQTGIQYGYGMWLYPGHAPYDFEANGRGGQRITVVPQWNAVIVVTGGGMDANVVAPLLARAFQSTAPLPANEAGDARLAGIVSAVAAPPAPSVVASLPSVCTTLGGKTYFLPANPLGVQSLTLSFPLTTGDASVRFGFADGSSEEHAIGLDGVPKLSPNLVTGLPVAVTGQWKNGAFEIDYDEVARINDYKLVLTPSVSGLLVRLSERSGLANMTMTATTGNTEQIVAGIGDHHG